MFRLLYFVINLVLLLIIISFIFSNPFIISLDIGNFKYSFSSIIFSIVALLILITFYFFTYIFFKSRFSINNFFIKNKYKRLEKGHLHFVDAMIAISNKDNRNAIKFHKKMINYIKDDPSLSLLVKSEVYKMERKYSELVDVYEMMIKSKKMEALGYRGLMEHNLNNHDYHHAFLYGEKLFSLSPSIEKLYETLVYIAAKTKNWNQIISISEKAYSQKIININTFNENNSVAYYEIAKIKFSSNFKEANKNITKALNLKKNFSPYIKLHLELIADSNNQSLLKKMIKKYWYLNPDQTLRLIITDIIRNNNLGDLNFINQIIKSNTNNEESRKMLIYFAIKNQNWQIARNKITGLIGSNPSREVCLFMADIELGENNDKQKSDSWIMRSEGTFSENTWICKFTNQSQQDWNSLSDSGYFNSLVLSNSKMIE